MNISLPLKGKRVFIKWKIGPISRSKAKRRACRDNKIKRYSGV